jgi:cohesin complex subunit SA-1/2
MDQAMAAAYPLISRAKNLKPFKINLDLFISLLIKTMAISDTLFEEAETTSHTIPLISILLTWLNTMSSSPLRPIRHTSTYMALKVVTELCSQAGELGKELNLKQRQRDMEAKKSGVGPAYQKKMKEIEAKVKEVHDKKARLEELMRESFDTCVQLFLPGDSVKLTSSLFVHRVRDADPNIRTDCLKELGVWVRKYPDLYTGNSFLQYLSRGTNDPVS